MSQYINILPIHSLETSKSQSKKDGVLSICGMCPGTLSEAQVCLDMPLALIQGCVPASDTGCSQVHTVNLISKQQSLPNLLL